MIDSWINFKLECIVAFRITFCHRNIVLLSIYLFFTKSSFRWMAIPGLFLFEKLTMYISQSIIRLFRDSYFIFQPLFVFAAFLISLQFLEMLCGSVVTEGFPERLAASQK